VERRLVEIVTASERRMAVLRAVRALALPDAYVAAGFVRNAVWSALFPSGLTIPSDVDVVYFSTEPRDEKALEARLAEAVPGELHSVTNQAEMASWNGDEPYRSTADAMAHWPETATAVGVRLTADDRVEVIAPYGLDDLFAGIVRPTPAFAAKPEAFAARQVDKRFAERFPGVRIAPPSLTSGAAECSSTPR
jgi:hypothetical protein